MTEPLLPPKRKDPLARTTPPLTPPGAQSRKAHEFTRAAAEGRFALQRCAGCGTYLWPARDGCPECLSADLPMTDATPRGEILSRTTAEVPADPYFRAHAPWHLGLVRLADGPTALAHLHGDCPETGPVRLSLQLDRSGRAVLFARPMEEVPNMADDPEWREMTAQPKHRRVLITDARHPAALPLAKALLKLGAAEVFAGVPEGWKPFPARAAFDTLGATLLPLDVTDDRSVADLAASHGGKVEILINTTDFVRPGGLLSATALNHGRDAMERLCFGLMRLARGFAPAMAGRGGDGVRSAVAWVNLFSIAGRVADPGFAGYSAAQAAAVSVSHALRAELMAGGIRMTNVFTGPLEGEWFEDFPPPKVTPGALASAVTDALLRGLEEVHVGDIAKDLAARLEANPKAVERDMAHRHGGGQ